MKSSINLLRYTVLILLTILIASCNKDEADKFVNTRTVEDVIEDFSSLQFNEGINDIEMEGSFSNVVWRFRVIVPEGASELNKRPLIVCLHGAATTIDPQLHTYTACLEEPGLAALDAYLLCPNSEGWPWTGIPEQEKVLTLTSLVKNNLHVDQNKVAIMGYSDGGIGAWYYAQYYPEAYSAAIPMASLYNPVRPEGNIPVKIDIPLYVIHGENDQLFELRITQQYVDISIDAGSDIEFVIAPELDHYNSCNYVPYLKDAATWLQTEVWK
jgi:predicted peptidase